MRVGSRSIAFLLFLCLIILGLYFQFVDRPAQSITLFIEQRESATATAVISLSDSPFDSVRVIAQRASVEEARYAFVVHAPGAWEGQPVGNILREEERYGKSVFPSIAVSTSEDTLSAWGIDKPTIRSSGVQLDSDKEMVIGLIDKVERHIHLLQQPARLQLTTIVFSEQRPFPLLWCRQPLAILETPQSGDEKQQFDLTVSPPILFNDIEKGAELTLPDGELTSFEGVELLLEVAAGPEPSSSDVQKHWAAATLSVPPNADVQIWSEKMIGELAVGRSTSTILIGTPPAIEMPTLGLRLFIDGFSYLRLQSTTLEFQGRVTSMILNGKEFLPTRMATLSPFWVAIWSGIVIGLILYVLVGQRAGR